MGAVTQAIRDKLTERFAPNRLEIADDSDRHHGHEGTREGGESHFTVVIEAKAFEGESKIHRQRLVYETLSEELAGPVHALSVKALAPGEI